MFEPGALWRLRPDKVRDYEDDPILRFCRAPGFDKTMAELGTIDDSRTLGSCFIVLDATPKFGPAGAMQYRLFVMKPPEDDVPHLRGYVLFPSKAVTGWDKRSYEMWWNHFFERLA